MRKFTLRKTALGLLSVCILTQVAGCGEKPHIVVAHAAESGVTTQSQADRVRQSILDLERYPTADTFVDSRLAAFNEAGPNVFSDLAKIDDAEQIAATANNLRRLAVAYRTQTSKAYRNDQVKEVINRGVEMILANSWSEGRAKFRNWWYTDIGIAGPMADLTLLMDGELSDANEQGVKRALLHYVPNPSKTVTSNGNVVDQSGANAIAQGRHRYIVGLAVGDSDMASSGFEAAAKTITYASDETNGNGIYEDGSYVYHNNVASNASYGAEDIRDLAYFLHPMNKDELDRINMQPIHDFISKGIVPIVNDGQIFNSFRGRSVSRNTNESSEVSILLSNAIIVAYKLGDERLVRDLSGAFGSADVSPEAQRIIDTMVGDKSYSRAPGIHNLEQIKRVVTYSEDQNASILSMTSNKIVSHESINGENLTGWYQGAGSLIVENARAGDFDRAYWTTHDPKRIPGTTVTDVDLPTGKSTSVQESSFTGTLEAYGVALSTMTYKDPSGKLSANKTWLSMPGEVLAIGSGIRNSGTARAYTTVESRKSRGYTVTTSDTSAILDGSGTKNDILYTALEGTRFVSSSETRTAIGNGDITTVGTDNQTRTADYLHVEVDHSTTDKYAYLMAHGKNALNADRTARYSSIDNQENIQVVTLAAPNGEEVIAVVLRSGEYTSPSGLRLTQPGLYLIKGSEFAFYDPSGGELSPMEPYGEDTSRRVRGKTARYYTVQEGVDFKTRYIRDDELSFGQTRVVSPGSPGYGNRPPQDRVIAVGTHSEEYETPFTRKVQHNPEQPVGYEKEIQHGDTGLSKREFDVNPETGEVSIRIVVIKEPVTAITEIGTGSNEREPIDGSDQEGPGDTTVPTNGELDHLDKGETQPETPSDTIVESPVKTDVEGESPSDPNTSSTSQPNPTSSTSNDDQEDLGITNKDFPHGDAGAAQDPVMGKQSVTDGSSTTINAGATKIQSSPDASSVASHNQSDSSSTTQSKSATSTTNPQATPTQTEAVNQESPDVKPSVNTSGTSTPSIAAAALTVLVSVGGIFSLIKFRRRGE